MSLLNRLCVPCVITVLERNIGRYQRARSLLAGPMTSSMTFASELIIHVGRQLARGDAVGQQHGRLASNVEPIPGGSREGGPNLAADYLFHGAGKSHVQGSAVLRVRAAGHTQPAGNDH